MKILSDNQVPKYLDSEGLLGLLKGFDPNYSPTIEAPVENQRNSPSISPDFPDLARTHNLNLNRNCNVALEVGTGYSTHVIPDATLIISGDCGPIPASMTNSTNYLDLEILKEPRE
jgi:hypothetical protein